jgi:hypothetical protein
MQSKILQSAKQLGFAVALGALAIALSGTANAAITYDTSLVSPPGVYFGTGNPNNGFTVDIENGVELGLATELRFVGNVTPTSTNIYNVPTGTSGGDALWDFVFSVNLQPGGAAGNSGLTLSGITPTITLTNLGNSDTISFNPLTSLTDNAGWGPSSPPDNTVSAANLATDTGFQNAENFSFSILPIVLGFDPNAPGNYEVTLSFVDTANSDSLGSVTEYINATSAVPEPATWAMMLIGFGLVGLQLKRRNAARSFTA